jgi:hypothetical protein
MFGAGRQLPQLEVLELGPHASTSHELVEHFIDFSGAAHGGVNTPVACFGPGDVERVVCFCPGLQRLWLPGLVQAGVDVSALLRLTALTGLFVGGEVWNDAVCVSVLAGICGLQLCDAPDFTDQGLLALSALTGLTKLGVLSCGLSAALPTFLDGCETTDEDEEEGCFLLWKQVGGWWTHLCCVTLDVTRLWQCFRKYAGNTACIAFQWVVIQMILQHSERALLVLACSTDFFVLFSVVAGPARCCVAAAAAPAVIWSFAGSKHRSAWQHMLQASGNACVASSAVAEIACCTLQMAAKVPLVWLSCVVQTRNASAVAGRRFCSVGDILCDSVITQRVCGLKYFVIVS